MKEHKLDVIEYEYRVKDYDDKGMVGERSLIKDKIRKIYDIYIPGCNTILRKIEKKEGIKYFLIDIEKYGD